MGTPQDKLTMISKLKKNWNGYGACEFDREAIRFARDITDSLPAEPQIFPMAVGGIQIDLWDGDRNLSIVVNHDGMFASVMTYESAELIHEQKTKTISEVSDMAKTWFEMKEPAEYPRMS